MDDLIQGYYGWLNPEAFLSCDARTPNSGTCLECFSNQFFYGNEISYDCVEKRKLYVLRYFPVHCMENYRGATGIPRDVVDRWFEDGYVNILSIGGGPGADVCGVLEYIEREKERRDESLSVDILRLDMEDQWDDVFDDVMRRFFPWATHRTVHLDVRYGLGSVTDDDFDLVTVSYLTSELDTEACLDLADEVDTFLVEGGVLMINDRPEEAVENDIRSMLERIELNYTERYFNEWAGYSYPNDVASVVRPKFRMNSKVFVGVRR